ncbi:DUF2812 domain-containing protein [Paenibacillus sp. Soil750]|uniref:DUF2812 domain-containing protein n=1 Tax=Paenibacillus sp. Soil750 TaxID=1736398 RepID=UPI0006F8ABDB|nr:DUF2812 domain-containing protein [Paenibacillus sp. Soil750]KRE73825.1 hypothetical protein ASL11_05770 [Paenibacillus sp. Soil750]
MNETKKVFKWWDSSQSETITAWLEDMEAQGWHLQRVNWNGLRFHFEKGAPRKMSYCVDYQTKVDPNYASIFEDTGWDKIYSGAGWYIWRQTYQHTKPEIFTDIDSMIERNKRLIGVFTAVTAAQIPVFMINIKNTFFYPLLILYVPVLVLLVISLYRLVAANKKLQAKKDIL